MDRNDVEVSFLGDAIAPEITVKGMGTIGKYNPLKQCIEIYRIKNQCSPLTECLPDEIRCKRKDIPTKIKSWLQLRK